MSRSSTTNATILIIAPKYATDRVHKYYKNILPIGLGYISSVLKDAGYEVEFLNAWLHDGPVEDIIKETLSKQEYSFVLTGGLSVHYPTVKNCVDSVRKYASFARVILGGGIISSQPDLMFRVLQPDYIIIGEGELTILELLEHLNNDRDLSEVNGIGYRDPEGKLVLTGPREPIRDIDSLPWPDFEALGLDTILDSTLPSDLYYYDLFDSPRPYPLIASRSCPYRCTFCFHPIGNKYRQRSIANIIDELTFAINRYKINIVEFYDELFSYDKKRVHDLCTQLKQLFESVPWKVKWTCQMRVDTIDDELLETMKDAGCYLLSLGLESYSPTVLKSMRKHITPQQIDNALRTTHRHNMTIQGNFIFGDVAETTKTAYETLNYWKQNSDLFGGGISLGFIQPYPGTALYEHALKSGIIKDEIDFIENHLLEPINMSDTMTEREFEQLRLDIAVARLSHARCQRPLPGRERHNGTWAVHVRCPYCDVVSVYRHYAPPAGWQSYHDICCRHCRMRFQLVSLAGKLRNVLFRMALRITPKSYWCLRSVKKIMDNVTGYVRRLWAERTMTWGKGSGPSTD